MEATINLGKSMKHFVLCLENDPFFAPYCSYLSGSSQNRAETSRLLQSIQCKWSEAAMTAEEHWSFGADAMGITVEHLKEMVFDALRYIYMALLFSWVMRSLRGGNT
jgi:hypothetical protein